MNVFVFQFYYGVTFSFYLICVCIWYVYVNVIKLFVGGNGIFWPGFAMGMYLISGEDTKHLHSNFTEENRIVK